MKDKKNGHKQNTLEHIFAGLPDPQAFWQEIKRMQT